MLKNGKRIFLLNSIAALAYLSIVLQGLVAVLPFVPGLVRSDIFKTYLSNQNDIAQQSSVTPAIAPESLSLVFTVLAVALAVCVLVAGVMAMTRIPAAIGKSGAKLTISAAEAVLPVITHHKKTTAKKKQLLTARIIFDIKLALIVAPLLLALVSPIETLQTMSRDLYVFLAAVMAAWSLSLFCLQIILARTLRIDLSRIW